MRKTKCTVLDLGQQQGWERTWSIMLSCYLMIAMTDSTDLAIKQQPKGAEVSPQPFISTTISTCTTEVSDDRLFDHSHFHIHSAVDFYKQGTLGLDFPGAF